MMLRAYFNEKAAIWDGVASERDVNKLERMSQRLDIASGSTVLDVGTGTGVFIPFIWSKVGRKGQIIGLDFAAEMLKIARSKYFKGNIDYLCADVSDMPCDDGIFESVVCYSSFPHFQDKLKALAEINRVTRSGGKLFICHTSSRKDINHLHRQIPVLQHDILPDKGEMQLLLTEAGFTDIEIEDDSESYLAQARKL